MNPSVAVEWIPPFVALAIGLAAGGLLLLRANRVRGPDARRPAPAGTQARDLLAKRDALIRQLQELEDTGSKRTPAQLARERHDLELEAARVLLALDMEGVAAGRGKVREDAAKLPLPTAGRTPRAGLRGFFWGVGSATALLLIAFSAWQASNPREQGGSVTGGGATSAMGPAASDDAELAAAVARNPSDAGAHLALAGAKLARRDLMGVWNEAGRVLEISPGNPTALAYQAAVRIAMGQPGIAVDLLRKSIAADPDLIDAHAWLAMAYARMGRKQEADAAVTAAARRFPDRAEEFRRLLADANRDDAAGGADVSPEEPHAAPAAAVPASGRTSRRHVSGRIDLDPSLAGAVPPGAVLFVFVRAAGVSAGPPVAVKRLPPVFPASFDLSDADAMMGQPFPDPLLIEARLDEDGDPTTRPPTDPKARLDSIHAGRTDLRLTLKRP